MSPRLFGLVIAFATLVLGGCASAPAPAAQTPASAAVEAEPSADELIPNAKRPTEHLLTGGPPSDAALESAAQQGYTTVISLLPEDAQNEKERETAISLGMTFVSIPVRGAEDLTEDKARALGDVFAEHEGERMILHCGSGNRAGALLALEGFFVEGMKPADALALGERAGLTKLREAVEQVLEGACASEPTRC